jgi:RNA polymerase sigma factor (sigma-70 family)
MTGPSANGGGINPCGLTDEQLAALVRGQGRRHPAAAELMLRYHAWVARQVRCLGHGHCQPEELADAGHEALFALLEAAEAYDPARAGDCSFRSFLGKVLRRRLANFLRGRHRAERRLDRSLGPDEALERGGDPRIGAGAPEASQEEAELHEQLHQALARLAPQPRALLEQLLAGASLPDAARQLGLPYHQANRMRRRALAFLKACLKDWQP